MSKELTNISAAVMNKIHQDKIKMRPKVYFVIGSVLTFVGLVLSIISSIFLVSLMRFSFRARGMMAEVRLEALMEQFSWWAPVLAIISVGLGVWLLKRYDFTYKINPAVLIAGFVLAVIVAGLVLDLTGLNDVLFARGPMHGGLWKMMYLNN